MGCQTNGPVGLLPVGIVGGLKWEGPLCRRGEVLLFHTAWKPERPFPLDMAGFVIKVSLLLDNPNARFSYYTRRGYLETDFLLKVLKLDNYAEKGLTLTQVGKLARERTVALADDCSKILVWHTRTEKPKAKDELRRIKEGRPSPDSCFNQVSDCLLSLSVCNGNRRFCDRPVVLDLGFDLDR